MIACPDRVTREAEQIANAQGVGTEQISLQADAIAITAGHLKNRLQARIKQQAAHRHTAHAHHRPTAIGDVDGMDPAPQGFGHRQSLGGITTARGHHLRGNRRLT